MELDLSKARETVRELAEALAELDGTVVDEAPTRAGRRQRTEISRKLQYVNHLGQRSSIEIMDVFFAFRRVDGEPHEGRTSGEPTQ